MKKLYIIILSFLIGIIFFSLFIINSKEIYFNLKGNNVFEVNIGDEFKDPGFEALYCTKYFKLFCKNINNAVNITTYITKDEKKVFKNYVLEYKKQKKILQREINYVDNESPIIELVNNNMTFCPNHEYIEEGYKAYDNVDGDLTKMVEVTINNNKVYYNVVDSSGNKKVVYRDIHYEDKIAPTIKLVGGEKNYIFLNQAYNEKGYTSIDNCDGDITKNVVVNNKVNTSKTGNYKIEYSVVDSSGNKNIVTREVIVYDDIATIPKNGKIIYLTFDDGPCVYTESILNVLNKYNVKATFFVTNQFSRYQYMIKKEYDSGHSIAVHTYSHNYDMVYSSLENYLDDFNNMNNIIFEQTGIYSKLFRFPGGSSNTISKFNKGIVTIIANKMTELGYHYFDWNVDSTDTSTTDPDKIYNAVISEIEKNESSVVLMHDIKKANIESVEKIINYGLENGYTFLPLDENIAPVHHKINN